MSAGAHVSDSERVSTRVSEKTWLAGIRAGDSDESLEAPRCAWRLLSACIARCSGAPAEEADDGRGVKPPCSKVDWDNVNS